MVSLVEMENGHVGYVPLVKLVRDYGKMRSPRGMKTYDFGHIVIVVNSPFDAMPLNVGRSLKPVIGAAEAIQLIAGYTNHELMPRISPAFSRFTEPGGRYHGAYGDRIGGQVGAAVEKIRSDRDSRQAVITLWDPQRDNLPNRRDYPCTVALNFAIVDNLLELRTQMRSNDVWLGFPYDVFQFTQLQLTVARALGVEPGKYTHSTWSLHIYEEHIHLVDDLNPHITVSPFQPTGFGASNDSWTQCQKRAYDILCMSASGIHASPLTESELWYVKQLEPYRT